MASEVTRRPATRVRKRSRHPGHANPANRAANGGAAAAGRTPAHDPATADGWGPDDHPVVSIVVPMLDERKYIGACLDGFTAQTYPLDRIEIIVVDAGSTDGSRGYVETRAADGPLRIRIVDNPRRKASAAFNLGATASVGDVICLFSSHGVPSRTFVAAAVDALRDTGADGIGGRYDHVGLDRTANAIGLAMVSPAGMASPHRSATTRAEVDTISHPAYRRESLLAVGPFDERLERNSDYELNYRMRREGMRLVFEPSVVSVYRPRGSLAALSRQFWWYGRWKERVIRRHPASMRLRHAVPPLAVAAVAAAPLIARTPLGRRAVAAGAVGYAAVVVAAVRHARPADHDADPFTLAACFPVMHAAWGAGFLASVAEDLVGKSPR